MVDLVFSAYRDNDLTVMAAEVIQGHDSSILTDDVNDGLCHSALVESWFATFTELLVIQPYTNIQFNNTTSFVLIPF